MNSEFPIDAVVLWVDGDDPAHIAKRVKYMHNGREAQHNDVAGTVRYRQTGEINFCIASILRFAPFVRKIHIVTDNQNPHLEQLIALNFPDNKIPVEIVDHKVIFRGYEQYLPTFNAYAIESMLWRIPDLAEHFIYFNDDVMLVSPARRSDFFTDEGWPVAYAYRHKSFTARLLRAIRPRRGGHRKLVWRDSMLNSADILGLHGFLRIKHTTHQLCRSFFERYYAAHPDTLLRNISHRFRVPENFNAQTLFYMAKEQMGECRVESPLNKYIYIKSKLPADEELKQYDDNRVLFCCINSMCDGSQEDMEQIVTWLSKRLDIRLPHSCKDE